MLAAMTVHFAQPMILATAAAAVVPWAAVWRARRRGRVVPWRAALLQSLALLALAAALAQPRLSGGAEAMKPVAIFVDVSASQTSLPDTLQVDLPAGLARQDYVFADTIAQPGQAAEPNRTQLAPVLSLLAGRADEVSAAVIVTDGHIADLADARRAAQAVSAARLPVFFVGRAPAQADARVADLAVRQTGPGGPLELAVTVVATGPMRASLRLSRRGQAEPVGESSLQLLADQPVTLKFADEPPPDQPAVYRAELTADDLLAANNVMTALAPADERRAVLWAADWPAPADLTTPAQTVASVARSALPGSTDELLAYAAVFVSDASGRGLDAAQRSALGEYVGLGGGLVFAGAGPHAGPEDRDDPLNRVLPLRASPYERKTLDVTVLLDASGSMGRPPAATGPGTAPSLPKFEVARQATLAMARRQLVAGDFLRVYSFKSSVAERFAGAASPEGLDRLERALAGVQPSGGTRITPALEAAVQVTPAEGQDRLVIVLSDLQTEAFDAEAWAARLAEAHVALAVVATGRADEKAPLKQLADRLDAPFIYRDDLGGLAEVFIQFLRRARGDVLVRRQAAIRIDAPLFDTNLTALPDADDYIAAVLAERAERLASASDAQPLIARWRARAGRSVALALPLEGPYNRQWRRSPEAATLLAAAVEWAAMPAGDSRFYGQVDRPSGAPRLSIWAEDDGRPINGLAPLAEVSGADGQAEAVAVPQTAPGLYQAGLPPWGASPAMVRVRVEDSQGARLVWRQAMPGRYAEELTRVGVNDAALEELARWTGGAVISADELARRMRAVRRAQGVELWPYLVGLALALMLIEWVTTRLVRKSQETPAG